MNYTPRGSDRSPVTSLSRRPRQQRLGDEVLVTLREALLDVEERSSVQAASYRQQPRKVSRLD
jgi:hypothetical protein